MNFRSKHCELLYKDLSLRSEKNLIFKDISGKISACTMVALIGTSGAGKTSLLNSLAGRISDNLTLNGSIMINNIPRDPTTWPKIIGYVEQEFYAYETQTVEETFKLICDFKNENTEKVNEMLEVLNLVSVKNNYISQLSGGEKKRVSIGVEVIRNPSLLFLDEPTSGLDSFNAINILETLQKLKELGKSVLITIHQPSFKMLEYFDKVILMGRGGTVFEGRFDACFDFFKENGFTCPEHTNPSDFFLETISINTTTKESQIESEKNLGKLIQAWKAKNTVYTPVIYSKLEVEREYLNYFSFIPLLKRNFYNYLRDLNYLKILFFQKTIFILIVGLTFLQLGDSQQSIQSKAGVITFIIINSLFGTCGPIFNIFAIEKKIIIRERNSGFYDGINAFLAKFFVEFFFLFFLTIYYISSIYWLVGLNSGSGRFFIFLIIQISIMAYAIGFALFVSALSPTQAISQVLGSTILIVFIVYGGFFSSPSTIPSWLRWIIWLSPVNYAFRACMQIIFNGQKFNCSGSDCIKTGEEVLLKYEIYNIGTWSCIFVIWAFTLLIIALGCICLHWVTRLKIKMSANNNHS